MQDLKQNKYSITYVYNNHKNNNGAFGKAEKPTTQQKTRKPP
jgi:hypothetical protein